MQKNVDFWAFLTRNFLKSGSFSPWITVSTLCIFCLTACSSQESTVPPHSATPSPAKPLDSIPAQALVAKSYLLGKFDPATHPDFVPIKSPYTDKSGMMLRKEALDAFEKMWKSAKSAGISLKIISSTRTFTQQKAIWENKWSRFAAEAPDPTKRALKILEFSSMPGSSRHHWGTDIDLNDLHNSAFEPGGKYEKVYQWLVAHAAEFGYCQPYTAGRKAGYQEEKWHWSYTPLSKPFLAQYKAQVQEADIQGFLGADQAKAVGAIPNYVLGINWLCAE